MSFYRVVFSAVVFLCFSVLCACASRKSDGNKASEKNKDKPEIEYIDGVLENDLQEPAVFKPTEPEELKYFRLAYPDVKFLAYFDEEKKDWAILVVANGKTTLLYWCDCRFLPENEVQNKNSYRKMLYKYSSAVKNPENFTEQEISEIKTFTSKENRTSSAIDPPFLYDAIYESFSRQTIERHIVKIGFLTKSMNVHDRVSEKLAAISTKIMNLPKTPELEKFFATLDRTDAYVWRSVRDTQNRSFHSLGLAVDILPKGYYQKIIYWGWERQRKPDRWFMIPLEKRWMPPAEVRQIFAEAGFIWGGTWIVWDNMHFEYRPEILLFSAEN